MNLQIEKLMEMFGRTSLERDLLAAENEQLKKQLIEQEKAKKSENEK